MASNIAGMTFLPTLFSAQELQLTRWREQHLKMVENPAFGIPTLTQEDVQFMADIGLDAYRFSISWSRLIPDGRGAVNPKGLEFYNNLINELVSHGIEPHVFLVNYDHPQALEDEYGGWVSRKMVYGLRTFLIVGRTSPNMQTCVLESLETGLSIGLRTVNEPNILVQGGYDQALAPPLRCSPPFASINCSTGNSSTEPYLALHHILLAHASAVKLYKSNYQHRQHGLIGLSIFAFWYVPATDTKEDIVATQRANDFLIGSVLDPLVFGDYPKTMKRNAGSRLQSFTKLESEMVKGSFDFIGIIHYLTLKVKDDPVSLMIQNRDYSADQAVKLIMDYDIVMDYEVPITPWGLEGLLEYIKQVYGNPPVFIYENGQRMRRNSSLEDTPRIEYIQAYIGGVLNALRNGSNTRGYVTWSFLDVFELFNGYESAYGFFYVDINDPDLKRYPKLSAHWYSKFLKGEIVDLERVIKTKENLSALPS